MHRDPIHIDFLVSELKGFDNMHEMINAMDEPINVRQITVEMNLVDFFSFFKRFSVTLSISGMIEGMEYTTV